MALGTGSGRGSGLSLTAYFDSHVISMRIGISFLTGRVSSVGGSILKSVSVAGMIPEICILLPCLTNWNGTCLYGAVCQAN
jgi:hypothetical protein